jgi:cold shock CspA family protein
MSALANGKFQGRVKWFNNKSGYGFITATVPITDGSTTSEAKDIFVHYSAIQSSSQATPQPDQSQPSDRIYKYLVDGEYVEFLLEYLSSGNHSMQAKEVTGINGGPLQCENFRMRGPRVGGPYRGGPSSRGGNGNGNSKSAIPTDV